MTTDQTASNTTCGKRAPVQGQRGKPPGSIAWSEHMEAWGHYALKYGRSQSAERLAERGGFGFYELTSLLGHEPTTWSAR